MAGGGKNHEAQRKTMESMQKNEKQSILLNWQDLNLGRLEYSDGKYVFYVNTGNKEAKAKSPVPADFLFYGKDVLESEAIFSFMSDFIPARSRVDITKKCGITIKDSPFEKMLKVATLQLERSDYWIELGAAT